MNIDQKIAELDAQIADREKVSQTLLADATEKNRIHTEACRAWSLVYNDVADMKRKRELLIELQKECECAIPVDEDIGRTVPLPPDVKGISGVMYPNIRADKHLIRTPIFKDEREFIEPK